MRFLRMGPLIMSLKIAYQGFLSSLRETEEQRERKRAEKALLNAARQWRATYKAEEFRVG